MSRFSIRLYWLAVLSNVIALGILLRGTVVTLRREEQILAIALTAISLVCWILYFGKTRK